MINKTRLKKRGYKNEYIEFIRKDTKKRNISIAVFMPLLGLLAAFIVWFITGEVEGIQNLIYIALLWILLVIPFPLIDAIKTQKEYKDLALRTKSEVVFDFNHRILHLVFKPVIELTAAVLVVAYFILFIEPFHVVFVHLLILWALYAAGRYSKFLSAPQLRDGYIYLYIFIMINQALIIFHIFSEIVTRSRCEECMSETGLLAGIIVGSLLFLKFMYYIFLFPKFNLTLKPR